MKSSYFLTLALGALCSVSLLPSCSSSDIAEALLGDAVVPANDSVAGLSFTVTSQNGKTSHIYFGRYAGPADGGGCLYTGSAIYLNGVRCDASISYKCVGNDVAGVYSRAEIIIRDIIAPSAIDGLSPDDIEDIDYISFTYHASDKRCDSVLAGPASVGSVVNLRAWASSFFLGASSPITHQTSQE